MATGTNTATFTTTYKDPSGTVTIKETSHTYDGMFDVELASIGVGTTSTVTIGVVLSTLKAFAMGINRSSGQSSNLTATATVNINDDGSPDKVITLTDTNGIGWSTGDTSANTVFLGTVDIASMTVHNTGTGLIDFFFRGLYQASS